MQPDNRDWRTRQHQNFSHHNYMHRSLAPRTLREAFGQEDFIESTEDTPGVDTTSGKIITVVSVVLLLALAVSPLFL